MAINCLLMLWKKLHTLGVSFLLTNRLNQDCIENMFSVIRGKGGHRDNPDAVQFRCAFRQVMVDAIMVGGSSANCEEDVDSFLLNLSSLGDAAASNHDVSVPNVPQPQSIPASVQSLLDVVTLPIPSGISIEECNIVAYIAGYVLRKIRQKLCVDCQASMFGQIDESNETHKFLFMKNNGDTLGGGLIAPSQCFYDIVKLLEKEYREICMNVIHMDKVMFRLVNHLEKKVTGQVMCDQCDIVALTVHLFVKIRLNHTLREQVKAWGCGTSGRKNRKVMKFSDQ